jgi:hypothetical protein
MELREHPFSEGFFNRLEVYLQEPGKYERKPPCICDTDRKLYTPSPQAVFVIALSSTV